MSWAMNCGVCGQHYLPVGDSPCPRCVPGSVSRFNVSLNDAAQRRIVRLADGRVGRLMGVSKRTRRVNVHVDGHFRRFDATDVIAFET